MRLKNNKLQTLKHCNNFENTSTNEGKKYFHYSMAHKVSN